MVSRQTLVSVSRRKVLSAFAAGEGSAGPTFTRDGPHARLYGLDEGYPVPGKLQAVVEGNPWAPKYRVGAFSHLDEIYATRTVYGATVPSTFKRSTAEVSYRFHGRSS